MFEDVCESDIFLDSGISEFPSRKDTEHSEKASSEECSIHDSLNQNVYRILHS